jgi:hypothetical protein
MHPDFSDGPFCRVEITRSSREGVRTWCVRDERHRVEPAGVRVRVLTSHTSFESCYYQGATRASWYAPVSEVRS